MNATKSNMKRLSETWKQQKHPRKSTSKPVHLHVQNASKKTTDVPATSFRRRLGQHAVCQKTSFTSSREGNASHVNATAYPKDGPLHLARRTSPRLKDKTANPQDGKESPSSDSSFGGSDFEIDDEVMKHVEKLEADFQQHCDKIDKEYSNSKSAIQLKSDKNVENVFKPGNNLQVDLMHQNSRKESNVFNDTKRQSAIHSFSKTGQNFVQSFVVTNPLKEDKSGSIVLCKDSQSPDGHSTSPIIRDQLSDAETCDPNDQPQDCDVFELRENSQGFNTQHLHRRRSSSSSSPISPPSSAPDSLQMSSWGLPEVVLNQYHMMGIQEMFPWQAQCLRKGQVLQGGNLIYSAPTSAGKTLVAELLILKTVLESKKKALVILPFVSVSREKMFYLQNLLQDTTVKADGFMGSHSPPGGLSAVDIAVCTIEKANSLINRLLEEKNLDQLGIVVVDELHMVGDSHRGYLLELLLTKIRYVTSKNSERSSIQIVGMSATLPNLDLLAKWLDADLFRTNFRPIPLTELVKIGPGLFNSGLQLVKNFDLKYDVGHDEDGIFSLSLETMGAGCAVLIFCPTKSWCEKLAENMARELCRLRGKIPVKSNGFIKASEFLSLEINHDALQDIIEQLKRTPAGLDATLKRTLPCAVAYHHAGLTFDERDIIEGGFRQGHIRILVATSTLSSGVNLPARRVIIRTIMFNRKVIDPLCYQQMAGRAGRKGVDTEGESILVCKQNEMEKAKNLLSSDLPPVKSCLIQRDGGELSNSMKRAILEVIASGVASTPDDVQRYSSSTLLAASLTSDDTDCNPSTTSTTNAIDACINFLKENEFVRLQQADDAGELFVPTQLGSATLASALSPHEALTVFTELQRARKSFVLENELHILYLVTPIYDSIQPDWYQFLGFWESLPSDKRRVGELVGIEERFLIRAAKGNIPSHTAKQQHLLAVHRRFHTAMILEELVNETPLTQVARKYSCTKGQLQSLQQSASTFAGMVTIFCSKLGWFNLELLLAQFQNRLNFGVQRELVDLVRISLLNAQRARLLYNSGFTSVAALANATPREVEGILRNAAPFKSGRQAVDENQFEAAERRAARCIWVSGKKGLTEAEAADMIIKEARQLVQAELGSVGIEWCPQVLPQRTSNMIVKGVNSSEGGQSVNHEEKQNTQTGEVTVSGIQVANRPCNGVQEGGQTVLRPGQDMKSSDLEKPDMSKIKDKNSASDRKMMEVKTGESSTSARKNSGLKVKGVSCPKEKNSGVKNNCRLVDQSVRGCSGSSIVNTAGDHGTNVKAAQNGKAMNCSSVVRSSGSHLQGERRVTENKKVGRVEEGQSTVSLKKGLAGERISLKDNANAQNDPGRTEDQMKMESLLDREVSQILPQASKSAVTSSLEDESALLKSAKSKKQSVNSTANSRCITPRGSTRFEKVKGQCDKFPANLGDKRVEEPSSSVRNVEPECNQLISDKGKGDEDLNPVSRDSKNVEKEKSPELFLDSPDGQQGAEPEGDKVQQCMDEYKPMRKETRSSSSPREEYSLLFSPIDSCMQDFLDNYDSQQELIAVSASPELSSKKEKHIEGKEVKEGQGKGTSKKLVMNERQSPVTSRCKLDATISGRLLRRSESRVHQDGHMHGACNGNSAGSDASINHRMKSSEFQGVKNRQLSKKFTQVDFGSNYVNADVKGNKLPTSSKEDKGCYAGGDVDSCRDTRDGCKEECLSPGTLAVLDMMADGDLDEVTFTMIKSPLQTESPDLFSEEVDVNQSLSDKVKGRAGSIKISEKRCGGVDFGGGVPSKDVGQGIDSITTSHGASAVDDRNLLSEINRSGASGAKNCVKVKSVDITSSTAGSWKEKRRKRKSNEKTPSDSGEGLKRTRGTENHKIGTRSKNEEQADSSLIAACNESFNRTPLKSKTPLSFLNIRNSRLSGKTHSRRMRSSSHKRKAQLSFYDETPGDVDIENVSSESDDLNEGNDLDIAMDSDELDIELGSPLMETPQSGAKFSQNKIDEKGLKVKQSEHRDRCLRDPVPLSKESQDADVRQLELSSELSVSESPSVSSYTPNTFSIIDVCSNINLFTTFLSEWRKKRRYAISVACERFEVPVEGGGIGAKYKKGRCSTPPEVNGLPLEHNSLLISGLAVSWGAKDAYFISFQKSNSAVDLDQSLSAPPLDQSISVEKRIQEVNSVLEMTSVFKGPRASSISKVGFDVKEQVKILVQVLGCLLPGPVEDPKVAHWLLDPSAKEKNLHGMVANYTPDQAGLLDSVGGGIGLSSLGISPQNPGSGRLRSCVESVLILDLMEALKQKLKDDNLYDAFRQIEMPSIMTLIHVELNGIGFSTEECETQKVFMQSKLTALEEQAYLLAGRSFSLTSPEDIAQVLYLELKLPPNGEVKNSNQGRVVMPTRKTLGGRGRAQMPKHFSTSKEALEKIKNLHPLPGLIVEWRKLSMSLTKVVFPLQKEKVYNKKLGMDRLFPVYQTHTATGRVATMDPNIQSIPKDFEISLPSVIGESPPHWTELREGTSKQKKQGKATRSSNQCKMKAGESDDKDEDLKTSVSLRHAFLPFQDGVFLAADYSQLELRILAHLSKDAKLIRILNSDGDVFRQIAAQWKNLDEKAVTDQQRQEAKQICYGMIYGIGARALSEQLGISEEDAACFMETFRDQYKGMKTFIKQVVENCQKSGYVQTISGRKRYLPFIHHSNMAARNHAERQAVNTTIQGSAADLVKTAMVKLQEKLAARFPPTNVSHRHKDKNLFACQTKRQTRRSQMSPLGQRGAYLVLQLHDELIYEVHKDDLDTVAQLVKKEMESAMTLSVKLPVKVKVGPTWGSLTEIM